MGKSEIHVSAAQETCNSVLPETGEQYYRDHMTMAETGEATVFHCELGPGEVREIMAASGLISLLRKSWLIAGIFLTALLVTGAVLWHAIAARPGASGTHHELLVYELAAGTCLCGLLVLWCIQRVWRLSPARQAHRALASGVWLRGVHEYKLMVEGVAWRSPDGSAAFVPWSVLTGIRETGRLFLLLDQGGHHVRGFIPKAALSNLPEDTELGQLIRERIVAAAAG